jgi:hypothetical protein
VVNTNGADTQASHVGVAYATSVAPPTAAAMLNALNDVASAMTTAGSSTNIAVPPTE